MVDISAVTVFWLDGRPVPMVVWGDLPHALGFVPGCKVSVTVMEGYIGITLVADGLGGVDIEDYTKKG